MVYKIGFGTDGWRGKIAEDYTFDNVRRAAQGFASYLLEQGKQGQWVVVGYDKRFASEDFAAATAEVLAGNGFNVYLTGDATPTPVIAFAVVDKKACGAVNITASHNPPADNGFKVRNENGGAIDPEGLKRIEALIPDSVESVKRIEQNSAMRDGKIVLLDPSDVYIANIRKLVDLQKIKDAGLTVLVDAMWGNGAGWFMKRPEPIRPNIDVGLQATVEHHADVLLITDGDADRCGFGDENGEFINQLRAYAVLALYLLEVRGERGPIVKALSTTTMLNKLGKLYNVPVYETGVGFKYIAPKMIETDAMIGGEESGGYAFQNHVPERDGILAGLYFLDFMVQTGKKPTGLLEMLFDKVGEHFYDRIDTPFSGDRKTREQAILNANPPTIGGLKVTELITVDGFQFRLEDGGWLLIRFSGTEPIMRVYCETTHADKVKAILQDGLKIAGITME
jgi:phosphomannomutase